MPASAPRPVPTMIAVGVARPIAHGQAMTRTAIAATRAWVRRGSGPSTNQTRNVRGGHDQDGRDEDLGDAVGQAGDGRLRALGALDELDDPGERGVPPDAGGAHDERAGRVEGRPDDLVAGALGGRDRLAGQQRLVDRRRAVDNDAVDRHLVARPNAQEVADDDRLERDVLLEVAADEPGRVGRSAASRRMAPVVWPFARASSQRPSRTSPMMIAALSK